MALGTVGAAQASISVPARRTGLLAWDVVKDGPSHWQAGIEWDSVLTDTAQVRGDLADATSKSFGLVTTGEGPSFYVYAAVDTQKIGGQDAATVARQRLEAIETVAVEQAIRDLILVPNAVNVGGNASTADEALALIEQSMAAQYGGLPMVMASVAMAVRLVASGAVDAPDQDLRAGQLWSPVGTPVAAGAGFQATDATVDGTPATGGGGWMFASGYPTLYRSEVIVSEAVQTASNKHLAVAERIYAAALDGPVIATLVDIA